MEIVTPENHLNLHLLHSALILTTVLQEKRALHHLDSLPSFLVMVDKADVEQRFHVPEIDAIRSLLRSASEDTEGTEEHFGKKSPKAAKARKKHRVSIRKGVLRYDSNSNTIHKSSVSVALLEADFVRVARQKKRKTLLTMPAIIYSMTVKYLSFRD